MRRGRRRRVREGDARARHNARWYFTGLAASLVGNSAMSLVAGIWVKALTGSSASAGLVSACVYAPTLVAPVAGLLADRFPRRAWLFAVNLISAATLLALLAVRSAATAWIVFAVMFAYGVEATLIDPAEDALFAQLFNVDFRRRINGWRLAIQETGRLVAPLLGAALFVLVGGGAVAERRPRRRLDRRRAQRRASDRPGRRARTRVIGLVDFAAGNLLRAAGGLPAALLVTRASYTSIYVVSAVISVAIAMWLGSRRAG